MKIQQKRILSHFYKTAKKCDAKLYTLGELIQIKIPCKVLI